MNKQTTKDKLQLISSREALSILKEKDANQFSLLNEDVLNYTAFPCQYTSLAGPFQKPGSLGAKVMTVFTIEIWSYQNSALIFCEGKVIEYTQNINESLKKYRILK